MKDYTYQNVYLMIHTKFPDGKRFSKQVKCAKLTILAAIAT